MADEKRDMRTAAQWERAHRAVRKGELGKGEERRWRTPYGWGHATFYAEEQTRPWNERDKARALRERHEAELERARQDAARELSERVRDAYSRGVRDERLHSLLCSCWRATLGELGLAEDDVRPHTAYQWVALGLVPIAEARWGRTGPAEDYFYCSPWDVRPDAERARRLMATAPREYDRLPDGRPYDGRPWW